MTTHKVTPLELDYSPVSLSEVKNFLSIDYDDFDGLLELLLKSAIAASQKSTGLIYQPSTVVVITDECENTYPVQPYAEWYKTVDSEPVSDSNARTYTYVAGFDGDEFPNDLRQAILQRVAEGFKYREDSVAEAVNQTSNASIYTEFSYRVNPMI